jgi:hypothetical protein
MSVVLRCPNCGTTRATVGECEACHEAQVRYFCTSHTPGLWLDAPTCPRCGARFGEAPRRASAPAPAMPARARPTASARAPASISGTPAPYSRRTPPESPAGIWGTREPTPPAGAEEPDARGSRLALWQNILRNAVLARYMARTAAPARERRPIGGSAGGCLMRMMLLVMFLFVALVSALFLFGGALLQAF